MAPSFAPVVTTSSVFESYEEDFHRLQRGVREQLTRAANKAGGGAASSRVSAAREASDLHSQASQALQQMELEARSMGSLASSITPKLKDYRTELATTRRQVREAEAALQREGIGLDRELTTDDKKTASDSFNRLRSSSRRLEDTKRTALEAEEIGLDVMADLGSQRESIMRTKAHLNETQDNLTMSKRVINTLNHRAVVNQLTVSALAFVLTIAVAIVMWTKLERIWQRLR